MLLVVHLLRSHQRLKKGLDALAAGCRKWSGWGTKLLSPWSLPPHGVWPRALALVATLPNVIFEVLRSKPSLVPSADTEGEEAAIDTGVPKKRKRGDE
jgi:hypothetical protein